MSLDDLDSKMCYNSAMAITEMLIWWYAHGWRVFVQRIKDAFSSIADFFSIGSLFRTLFKPFRQISAETADENASLDLRFHMFIDRLISRVVGFVMRFILILTGLIIISIGGVVGLVLIVLWPFVPLLPVAGIVLTVMGVSV